MSTDMSTPKRVVIESPLAGDFRENFRYLLWCCRAVWLRNGTHPIASHMLNPWFMDDRIDDERAAGINNPWAWDDRVPHLFFVDLGMSRGMGYAMNRCETEGIAHDTEYLEIVHAECWSAYQRGEWPPHTPGFEVAP